MSLPIVTGHPAAFPRQSASEQQSALQSPCMLSSRFHRLSQRRCWSQFCNAQPLNIQLSQQQISEFIASGQGGAFQVHLEVPAQQLVATIVTSPATEQPAPSSAAQPAASSQSDSSEQAAPHQAAAGEASASQGTSGLDPQATRPIHSRTPTSISRNGSSGVSSNRWPDASLLATDPFKHHLLTRSTKPRHWQSEANMPTTAQLRAAEQELQ